MIIFEQRISEEKAGFLHTAIEERLKHLDACLSIASSRQDAELLIETKTERRIQVELLALLQLEFPQVNREKRENRHTVKITGTIKDEDDITDFI
jgi:hypothetical protein